MVIDQIIKPIHVASSAHTDMCARGAICLKCHIGINSSHIGFLCQTRHPLYTIGLARINHLFGGRPKVVCQLKLQTAMHISENLLYKEFGIKGVSVKLSPTSNTVKLRWIYF